MSSELFAAEVLDYLYGDVDVEMAAADVMRCHRLALLARDEDLRASDDMICILAEIFVRSYTAGRGPYPGLPAGLARLLHRR